MTTIYQLDQELKEKLSKAGIGELMAQKKAYDDHEETYGFQGEYEEPTPSDGEEARNYNLDTKGSVIL